MDIHIHIEKRHLIFVVVLVCVLFVAGLSVAVVPNPGHGAEEVGNGTFGAGDFVFPNNLKVDSSFFLPTNVKGIFWGAAESNALPHINYDSANGLWISSGAGSGRLIHVEGGNLTAGNVTVNDRLVGDKIIANNVSSDYVSAQIKLDAVSGDIDYLSSQDISAGSVTATGKVTANRVNATNSITLDTVTRTDWPKETIAYDCPSGKFVNKTYVSGETIGVSCGTPSSEANVLVSSALSSSADPPSVSYTFTAPKTGTALIIAAIKSAGCAGVTYTFALSAGISLDSITLYGDDYHAFPVIMGTRSVTKGTSYTVTASGGQNCISINHAKIAVIIA